MDKRFYLGIAKLTKKIKVHTISFIEHPIDTVTSGDTVRISDFITHLESLWIQIHHISTPFIIDGISVETCGNLATVIIDECCNR